MKISTNKIELKALEACSSGYETFIKAHGDKEVTLSQCLTSNGWEDTWWLITGIYDQFSKQQKIDLRLLSCDYALTVIDIFEKDQPNDKRPRLAIEASQAFARSEITAEELDKAREAAWAAARAAASAAARAARAAARAAVREAAWAAARVAASAAASAAARAADVLNTKMLMDLLLKWEETK